MRCAWCKRLIEGQHDEQIAVGICSSCLERYFPHLAGKIKAILEEDERLTEANDLLNRARVCIKLGNDLIHEIRALPINN